MKMNSPEAANIPLNRPILRFDSHSPHTSLSLDAICFPSCLVNLIEEKDRRIPEENDDHWSYRHTSEVLQTNIRQQLASLFHWASPVQTKPKAESFLPVRESKYMGRLTSPCPEEPRWTGPKMAFTWYKYLCMG